MLRAESLKIMMRLNQQTRRKKCWKLTRIYMIHVERTMISGVPLIYHATRNRLNEDESESVEKNVEKLPP